MNISTVNTLRSPENQGSTGVNDGFLSIGRKGQVIEGIISKITDKITINFSGKEVQVDKNALRNAKEGQIRRFEITDVSKDRIELREVNRESAAAGAKIKCTVIGTDADTFLDIMDKSLETGSGGSAAKGAAGRTAGRMTGSGYEKLEKEGMSLESYEAGRLDRALERIHDNRQFREEAIEDVTQYREEAEQDIKKMSVAAKITDSMAKQIAKELVEKDIPITLENVSAILTAVDMAASVSGMTENGMAYLMQNQQEPTVQNIYHSEFSGYPAGPVDERAWAAIKEQAGEVLKEAGLDVNQKTQQEAKWLYQNGIPITKESFETLHMLKALKETMLPETLLAKMAEAMGNGLKPEEANLNPLPEQRAQKAVDDFGQISGEAVDYVAARDQVATLENYRSADARLQEEQARSGIEAVQKKVAEETANMTEEQKLQAVTARRQLEEIRFKLTQEAAVRLLKKGIVLDTSGLQEIVEGLRELEDTYYKNMLREGIGTVTDENVSLLKETLVKADELWKAPEYVLGVTLRQRQLQTVDTLHTAAADLQEKLQKAGEAYETLMTAPRQDMGDSIKKAFGNIDAILADMGLEPTEDNRRAVRILGYNSMEITEESITDIKAYDGAVTSMLKELQPAVTVELIRRGINPLNMNIEDLTEQLKQVKEEIGVTSEEKYSKYLWKLEKQGNIKENERKGYIGIYRLVNTLEKADGAAIGAVINAGQELTLRNLLTAVRSKKHSGMSAEIDDSFGAVQSTPVNRNSISEQIETGLSGSKREYTQQLAGRIMDALSPDKLEQVSASLEGGLEEVLSMNPEQLADALERAEDKALADRRYAREMAEEVRNIMSDGEEAVDFIENFQIPVTVGRLHAAEKYFTRKGSLYKDFQEKADNSNTGFEEMADFIQDAETLQKKYEEIHTRMDQLVKEQSINQADTYEAVREFRILGQGIALARVLEQKEHYEIPIVTGDRITNISLTVQKGKKENGKVQIGVDSERLGKIEAEFSVKEQVINGFVLCDSRDGEKAMLDCQKELLDCFGELGLKAGQINVGLDKKASSFLHKTDLGGDGQTGTRLLYQTARTFIKSIQAAEQNIE